MSGDRQNTVAAFDFDGTILKGDSLFPFLLLCFGPVKVAVNSIIVSPAIIEWLKGNLPRRQVRAQLMRRLFTGLPLGAIEEKAIAFSRRISAKKYLHSEIVGKLKWHREQNHYCVMVSASPDIYMRHIAKHLGFDHCISTEMIHNGVVYSGEHRVDICWGPEKARRLIGWIREIIPSGKIGIYAYGDSSGDNEMLALADNAYLVKGNSLRKIGN